MTTTTTTSNLNARTVAQGLRVAKQLKGRVAELSARLRKSASWTGTEAAAYDFAEVRKQRADAVMQLTTLKERIAKANAGATVTLPGGEVVSLHGAVLRYEETKGEVELIKQLPVQVSKERKDTRRQVEYDEATGRPTTQVVETMTFVALTERDRADEVERLQQLLTDIDAVIQDANHTTVLPT